MSEQTISQHYGAGVLKALPQSPRQLILVGVEDGKLAIDWMTGEPAPMAVLKLLSCQYKRVCRLPSCTCLANGLRCTNMCQLQECTNQPEEGPEDSPTGDSDDECEDD